MPALNMIAFRTWISSYLLLGESLEYSPKHQMAVFKITKACWKSFGSQDGALVASSLVFVASSPPYPWFLGELLASFRKYFPCLFNIVCTAVILSCTYLMANWFSISSNPVPHGSHWLWHNFDPKTRLIPASLRGGWEGFEGGCVSSIQ